MNLVKSEKENNEEIIRIWNGETLSKRQTREERGTETRRRN
jgi:hypothetical protein